MVLRGRLVSFRVVLVLAGVAVTAWAADLSSLDQVPEKAKAALMKLAGDNKILEVESEKEHGVAVYEASWKVDGREVEAEVTGDGVLLELEEGVDAQDVPEAVRAAAEQSLAGAEKIHYEKHTVVVYEAEGRVNGKAKEITVSPTGRVAGQAQAGQEAGSDEDGDDDGDDDGEEDSE